MVDLPTWQISWYRRKATSFVVDENLTGVTTSRGGGTLSFPLVAKKGRFLRVHIPPRLKPPLIIITFSLGINHQTRSNKPQTQYDHQTQRRTGGRGPLRAKERSSTLGHLQV